MSCKTIERLILESEERPLAEGDRRQVEGHLRKCPGCRRFKNDRQAIREALGGFRPEGLPPSLDLRTRRLCREALSGAEAGSRAKIPVPVIVASVLFSVLAVVWLTIALGDVEPGQPVPSGAWAAIAFIVQNVLMLVLSPVLLRGARPRDGEISSSRNGEFRRFS